MIIDIRLGTPADGDRLADLAARTFRDTFTEGSPPEDMALHLATTYGSLQQGRELADPHIVTLVAESSGELIAYAQLRNHPPPACVTGSAPIELWRFYVLRDWHGRGLAQKLMQRVDEEARRAGAQTLWLGVWEHNDRAKAFYRKCNFVDVGSHVFMVGHDGQTDRIMVRPLEGDHL
jgi:GNAT superfamily N-acetyltransferase